MFGGLRRWLDLREDERVPALQVMIVLFGVIAAHTMLETARDALFLGKLPPSRLSFVYALLAGLSLVAAKLNTMFVQRFGRRNALIFTLMMTAYGTTMIYLAPRTAEMAFVLYVWSGLIGTVLTVQFWMLAGQMFTVSQGKRLFGPLASGGVLGAVSGAAVAAVVLEFFDVSSLLVISPLLLIGTATLLTAVPSDLTQPRLERAARHKTVRTQTISTLAKDPYLLRLGAVIALVTACALSADYLFKSVTAREIPAEDLGLYLARYYAVLNAVALLVQLFLAGYLVRRIGVVASLAVMPLALMFGAAGTLLTGGALLAVWLTRGADGALRHSLHRVTSELMWMPLGEDVKNYAKGFADTVLGRGVQAAMAAGLLALAVLGWDTPMVLGAVVGGLALLAVVVTASLRRPYFDLFRRALARDSIGGDLADVDLDLNSAEIVIETLSSREPERVIAAMDLLVTQKRTKLIPALILYHDSDEVLIRALDVIASPERKDWVLLAERLLAHSNEDVRVAAVGALVAADHHELVMPRLADISPRVRAHTAFSLVQRTGSDPAQDAYVTDLLAIEGDKRQPTRQALLDAIGGRGDQRWAEVVLRIASDADDALNETLAEAMTAVRDERFIPILVSRLDSREGRSSLRRAIVSYGDPALAALDKAMRDPETDPRQRLHIPRTISQFRSQRAVDLLTRILVSDEDGAIRFKALRGLGRMVDEMPVRVPQATIGAELRRNLVEAMRLLALRTRLSASDQGLPERAKASGRLLLELLDDKHRQAFERVFRLMKLSHRSEDLRVVYDAVRSEDKHLRANALEFLDALTLGYPNIGEDHAAARDLIRISSDDLPPEEQLERAAPYLPELPENAEGALIMLLRENDPAVATIAAHHALMLGVVDLAREVASAAKERRFLELPEVARAG